MGLLLRSLWLAVVHCWLHLSITPRCTKPLIFSQRDRLLELSEKALCAMHMHAKHTTHVTYLVATCNTVCA